MTEIISIHVGSYGVRAAADFWSEMNRARMIDKNGAYRGSNEELDLEMSQIFHRVDKKKRFVPRAVLADLQSICFEDSMEKMFSEENLISGSGGSSNNCAKAYKYDGPLILDRVMNKIRKESEKCDFLQGFNLVQSLGEGTGSGLGSLLLEALSEDYPDLILSTFSVFPSRKVSDEGYQWGNSIFALNALMEVASMVISMDSESLVDKLLAAHTIDLIDEEHLRDPVKRMMVGTTASLHLPGTELNSQRKMSLTHVPFPTMHFLTPDVYPVASVNTEQSEVVKGIFDPKLVSNNSEKLFSAVTTFFGKNDRARLIHDIRKTKSSFAKVSRNTFIDTHLCRASHSACSVANSSYITQVFTRLLREFRSAFQKPTFVSWYSSEGMEPVDFEIIAHKLEDLSKLYNYKKNSSRVDLPMIGKIKGQVKVYKDFQLAK